MLGHSYPYHHFDISLFFTAYFPAGFNLFLHPYSLTCAHRDLVSASVLAELSGDSFAAFPVWQLKAARWCSGGGKFTPWSHALPWCGFQGFFLNFHTQQNCWRTNPVMYFKVSGIQSELPTVTIWVLWQVNPFTPFIWRFMTPLFRKNCSDFVCRNNLIQYSYWSLHYDFQMG